MLNFPWKGLLLSHNYRQGISSCYGFLWQALDFLYIDVLLVGTCVFFHDYLNKLP